MPADLTYLTRQFRRIIHDPSFEPQDVADLLNRAVSEVAAGFPVIADSDYITPPLPGLFSEMEITPEQGAEWVDLPPDFGRRVATAFVGDRRVPLEESWHEFRDRFPRAEAGTIDLVHPNGTRLYFGRVPTDPVPIRVNYYRRPREMSLPEDLPDGIPPGFEDRLIVNAAAMWAWELIEQGADGAAPNTNKYRALFHKGMLDLDAWLPVDGEAVGVGGDE